MDTFDKYIPNFLFILLRTGIVLSLVPFFSSQLFPPTFRIGMAVAISLILTPVVEIRPLTAEIPLVVIRELLFGLAFGFAARFIFYAVDMSGQIISSASGLSIATTFNPEIGQSSEISSILSILSTLLFMAMDAHHDLIYLFVKSYEWIPVGSAVATGGIVAMAVTLTGKMLIIALKLSAPIVILMLISNVILAFVYKAAPQINIFFMATPAYIFLAFLMLIIGMPMFLHVVGGLFSSLRDELGRIILQLRG